MGPMNSRDLQAFMAIAEELSFRRAAERLFIDQSALSRRIQGLEDELGYQLIFRTTREVVLTEAGRVFYEEVAPAMQALARAADVARTAAEGSRGDADQPRHQCLQACPFAHLDRGRRGQPAQADSGG